MINENTIKKLNQMRLTAMAEKYRLQQGDQSFESLFFDERLGLLVDYEWDRRKSNKLTRLIKNASFKFNHACIEDVEKHLIIVGKYYPSSQICSNCNVQNEQEKDLSRRTWVCPEYGVKHNRDHNASKNILREGLKQIA